MPEISRDALPFEQLDFLWKRERTFEIPPEVENISRRVETSEPMIKSRSPRLPNNSRAVGGNPALEWLLESRDPSIRTLTLTEVVGKTERSGAVQQARAAIPRGPRVRTLLQEQQRDGSFGNHPYSKWTGAHWRLVSLIELGIPTGHRRALAATNDVLRWLHRGEQARPARRINGLVRRHASQEGNAIAVCVRLGRATDPLVRTLVERLLDSQWPDGGWNCDPEPRARTSSFYETITPMWGLAEYARATHDTDARAAAERAAELFLERRLFLGKRSKKVINPRWLQLHYPLYWHYDILHGLLLLSRVVGLSDPRVNKALDVLESKRRPDGTWRAGASYWKPPGRTVTGVDVVDWGRQGPNEMITLNALRVLKRSGRL
jgi:hypothetical protein